MLENDLTANVEVKRKVNINLGGKTLTGNLSYDTTEAGSILLSNGTVTGNLTVDTPNVSFTNSATVNGTTTITDVANNTFTNNGYLGAVVINDANGTRFVNSGTVGTVTIGGTGNGSVLLEGAFSNVTVDRTSTIVLDGSISTLNVDANATATVVASSEEGSSASVGETSGEGTVESSVPIEAEVTAALNAVNLPENAVDVKSALETNADVLGLDLTNYNKLTTNSETEDRKLAVAKDVLLNKPDGGYTSATDLEAAFKTSVEIRSIFQDVVEAAQAGSPTFADLFTTPIAALTALDNQNFEIQGDSSATVSATIAGLNSLSGLVKTQDVNVTEIDFEGVISLTQVYTKVQEKLNP